MSLEEIKKERENAEREHFKKMSGSYQTKKNPYWFDGMIGYGNTGNRN